MLSMSIVFVNIFHQCQILEEFCCFFVQFTDAILNLSETDSAPDSQLYRNTQVAARNTLLSHSVSTEAP